MLVVNGAVLIGSAEESDYLTEYEDDGMDTVREEEGEEEEEEEPEDQAPAEWTQNGVFETDEEKSIRNRRKKPLEAASGTETSDSEPGRWSESGGGGRKLL
ncbi:patatin-like phospholipase domain-containing protein 6 isoform X1 [Acipenser oxyrinchus oxyrinchus]|uniref:Patatin-like phospholipase domain-containing protein 6 isoform X1 n=1 Tax=Acipenser oxyrinchus oxyrinchus TaxID=40147 RepID=A0AAD8CGR8_ACIOX|nr:patatin-like phospholipase domain-containing protein 6 isoform X1 [Acipenser oxyrinchus oxyrinchus]